MKYTLGWFIVLAALAGQVALPVAAANPDDADALLHQSFAAQNQLSYIGEVETLRFESSRAQATIVRIEHRQPDLTRRWYLAPPKLFGDSIVSVRHTTYEFDEHHHRVIQSSHVWADDATRLSREALLSRNFRAVLAGNGTIAGRSVRMINLLQRSTGQRLVSLALDEATSLPLERESYRVDGSIAFRMRFTSIRYIAPDALPVSIFSTEIPHDFTLINKEQTAMIHGNKTDPDASSDMARYHRKPEMLQGGFHLIRTSKTRLDSIAAQQWVYSDGVRTLSLFENPLDDRPEFAGLHPKTIPFENSSASLVENGSELLFSWPTSEGILTLVGDMSADELISIAHELSHAENQAHR
jgi:negative regulator of sigma E activity